MCPLSVNIVKLDTVDMSKRWSILTCTKESPVLLPPLYAVLSNTVEVWIWDHSSLDA